MYFFINFVLILTWVWPVSGTVVHPITDPPTRGQRLYMYKRTLAYTVRNRQVNYVGGERTVLITVSSLKVLFWCSTRFTSYPLPQGRGCEALLSGDLEGGHTDQGSAAAHPQSGEFLFLKYKCGRASQILDINFRNHKFEYYHYCNNAMSLCRWTYIPYNGKIGEYYIWRMSHLNVIGEF